jgi:uncharacterized alkaline shock family protein YloU
MAQSLRAGDASVAETAVLSMVRGAVAGVDGARLPPPGRVSRVLPGRRGPVEWRVERRRLRVEVEIVAEFGRVLPDLASEVQTAIAGALERMTELPVRSVDVTITAVERPAEAAR